VPGTLPGLISHLHGQWSPVSGRAHEDEGGPRYQSHSVALSRNQSQSPEWTCTDEDEGGHRNQSHSVALCRTQSHSAHSVALSRNHLSGRVPTRITRCAARLGRGCKRDPTQQAAGRPRASS